ncbi:MFS transporter [Campylobacter geochelonis]|uniref:MFS transporter n=1 Tax=Campylobacter geochelonis TaxID=1780362 RepID=UPI0007708A6A|nr:MFS transporter [Campylobacter geochelonis]CZE50756.1 major facilitator superfamily permease [Campylobacter geochelonis]
MSKIALNNPFASFKHPNFRLYWIGMNVSLIGSWMQTIALPWLALSITNDPFKVSIVAVAQFLPPLFLTLFSGALIDKFDKKKMLLIAQIGLMLVAMIFSFMVFTNTQTYEKILLFSFMSGVFNSIDAPSRQSIVHDLIDDKKNLPNAIALNSMSFNVARILGPSLAGLVMALWGVGYCFLINSISFFAIIVSLFFIKFKPFEKSSQLKSDTILYSIKKGLFYVKDRKILLEVLLITLVVATFIPNYNVTVSAFVKFNLDGSEKSFGYLMSFLGVGSFFGAFFVALAGRMKLKTIKILPIITALAVAFMGFTTQFYIIASLLILSGFGFVVTAASINSTLQLNTDNEFRGRVMSIYTLFFQGSTPFGAVYAGYFTNEFGAKWGFFSCGMAVVILLLLLYTLEKYKTNKKKI